MDRGWENRGKERVGSVRNASIESSIVSNCSNGTPLPEE